MDTHKIQRILKRSEERNTKFIHLPVNISQKGKTIDQNSQQNRHEVVTDLVDVEAERLDVDLEQALLAVDVWVWSLVQRFHLNLKPHAYSTSQTEPSKRLAKDNKYSTTVAQLGQTDMWQ